MKNTGPLFHLQARPISDSVQQIHIFSTFSLVSSDIYLHGYTRYAPAAIYLFFSLMYHPFTSHEER